VKNPLSVLATSILGLVIRLESQCTQPNDIAFYVSAHQDDWQLFCGEQAVADLKEPDKKVVFIHTTAGDGGRSDGWWEVRERGALASFRAVTPAAPLTFSIHQINGHKVSVYTCGNTVNYCLRLPDGVGDASLSNLRDNKLASLTAVDNSTTYHGWQDFCKTLEMIMELERSQIGTENPWVNALDYNSTRNPGDHCDHKATADAVRLFASNRYNRAWWSAYDIQNRAPNLSGAALASKRKTFKSYSDTVLLETTLNGFPVPLDEQEWQSWGNRSYVTIRNFGMADD